MLTELCVFHDANAFKDIISATKDFVAKNETRPLYQMVFLRGQKHAPYTLADQVYHRGQLTAIALDGYRVSHETCTRVTIEEDFTAYIFIPRVKPIKTDTVKLYRDEDGTIVLSYESAKSAIQFRSKQPHVSAVNHESLYQQVSETAIDLQTGCSASYLMDAAQSLTNNNRHVPVVINASLDPTKPIRLTQQNSTRIILPIRIKSTNNS